MKDVREILPRLPPPGETILDRSRKSKSAKKKDVGGKKNIVPHHLQSGKESKRRQENAMIVLLPRRREKTMPSGQSHRNGKVVAGRQLIKMAGTYNTSIVRAPRQFIIRMIHPNLLSAKKGMTVRMEVATMKLLPPRRAGAEAGTTPQKATVKVLNAEIVIVEGKNPPLQSAKINMAEVVIVAAKRTRRKRAEAKRSPPALKSLHPKDVAEAAAAVVVLRL